MWCRCFTVVVHNGSHICFFLLFIALFFGVGIVGYAARCMLCVARYLVV